MIVSRARDLVVLALIACVWFSTGVAPAETHAYGYDAPSYVVAAPHAAGAATTTRTASLRIAASSGKPSPRTLPGSVRLVSRRFLAAKGGTSIIKYDADFAIGQLTSRGAKASDLAGLAESQGWRRVQNPNGPIKYIDEGGVPRLTLKSGSARAPGSNFPHVEIRNAAGRRVDPYGNRVTRRSPGSHTGIGWDLP